MRSFILFLFVGGSVYNVVFFIFGLFATLNVFSNESSLVEALSFNENACVHHYDDEKIYLKEDIIKVTQQGIFLIINGNLIPLETLHSDNQGVFIYASVSKHRLKKCRGCGEYYTFWCTNPNCPLKQK